MRGVAAGTRSVGAVVSDPRRARWRPGANGAAHRGSCSRSPRPEECRPCTRVRSGTIGTNDGRSRTSRRRIRSEDGTHSLRRTLRRASRVLVFGERDGTSLLRTPRREPKARRWFLGGAEMNWSEVDPVPSDASAPSTRRASGGHGGRSVRRLELGVPALQESREVGRRKANALAALDVAKQARLLELLRLLARELP